MLRDGTVEAVAAGRLDCNEPSGAAEGMTSNPSHDVE
jgi:hypothetical protein